MIEGDRANYDSYDYNDYDLYAYDEDEDEKLREEYKLKQELSEIMDKLNMTTTESPLPNAVRNFLQCCQSFLILGQDLAPF